MAGGLSIKNAESCNWDLIRSVEIHSCYDNNLKVTGRDEIRVPEKREIERKRGKRERDRERERERERDDKLQKKDLKRDSVTAKW